MLVTVFVDESGTGGEPRMVLGALVAPAHQWHGFNRNWRKLLDQEGIEFSHVVAMRNREPPFEDWGNERTGKFLLRSSSWVQKYCDFGLTVALDLEVHRNEYRGKLHPKAHKDSAYGTCARGLFEAIYVMAKPFYGDRVCLDFVFENSDHFGEAKRVFDDAKRHVSEMKPHLGKIRSGEKGEFCALQGADALASVGRRNETKPVLSAPMTTEQQVAILTENRRCPLFHLPLKEGNMADFRRQAETIAKEKKHDKRARQWAKRLQRG